MLKILIPKKFVPGKFILKILVSKTFWRMPAIDIYTKIIDTKGNYIRSLYIKNSVYIGGSIYFSSTCTRAGIYIKSACKKGVDINNAGIISIYVRRACIVGPYTSSIYAKKAYTKFAFN